MQTQYHQVKIVLLGMMRPNAQKVKLFTLSATKALEPRKQKMKLELSDDISNKIPKTTKTHKMDCFLRSCWPKIQVCLTLCDFCIIYLSAFSLIFFLKNSLRGLDYLNNSQNNLRAVILPLFEEYFSVECVSMTFEKELQIFPCSSIQVPSSYYSC